MDYVQENRCRKVGLTRVFELGLMAVILLSCLRLFTSVLFSSKIVNLGYFGISFLALVFVPVVIVCALKLNTRAMGVVLPWLLYCSWCVLSRFWSIVPDRTLLYSFLLFCFQCSLVIFPVLLVGSGFMRLDRKAVRRIVTCLTVTLLILVSVGAVHGILEGVLVRGHIPTRLKGLGMHANGFGAVCLALAMVAHLRFRFSRGLLTKTAFAVGGICLLLTQSRGLIIAFGVYIFLYFLIRRRVKNILFLLVTVLPFLFVFSAARDAGNYVPAEFEAYGGTPRLFIWGNALEYVRENGYLLTGTGYDSGYELTSRTAVGDYFKRVRISRGLMEADSEKRVGVSLHGGISKIFFTTGIVGFVLFLWSTVVMAATLGRSSGETAAHGLPWLAALLTADLTSSFFWAASGPLASTAVFAVLGLLLVDAVRDFTGRPE